jgi:hypothetical protein
MQIVRVDLSLNNIDGAGVAALARALATNRTVTSFSMFGNPVGDRGTVDIVRALLDNIESPLTNLNLSSCGINVAGGHAIGLLCLFHSHLAVVNLRLNAVRPRVCVCVCVSVCVCVCVCGVRGDRTYALAIARVNEQTD